MSLLCWRCGGDLSNVVRSNERHPIERLAQCKACHADLHVCKMCRYFNPRVSEKCDHEIAEPARDFEIANFCQYYKPNPHAFSGGTPRQDEAVNRLKALFGEEQASQPAAEQPVSQEELARQKLEALFKNTEKTDKD